MRSKTATYLRAIEQCHSMSAAAEELGITQPALSSFLKKTERQIGATIFDRSKTPLALTDAGRAYLDYEDGVEALGRELDRKISDINNLECGTLSIGGATSFNTVYLPRALTAFTQRYPGIDVHVIDDTVPNLAQAALDGKIDVLISSNMPDSSQFELFEFVQETIYLCIPPDWPLVEAMPDPGPEGYAHIGQSHLAELAKCPFIVLHDDQQLGKKMRELFELYGIEPAHAIHTEQTLTSLALTMEGAGISLATEGSLAQGNLKRLPALFLPDKGTWRRKLYIARPKNRYTSRAAEKFIEVLKSTQDAA